MARFYRRSYGRRYGRFYARRYGRRYGRLYSRRYARRFVNGSSRSSIRMKCTQTMSSTLSAGYGDSASSAVVTRIRPYSNAAHSVTQNPLYQAYLNLYEETKMIGMKINLSVTSAIGGSDTPSLQIYTSWDRRHGYGEVQPSVVAIKGAASSSVATALNNNVAKLTRSIYASDLIEKAQWHDSTLTAGGEDQSWVTAALNPNFFCPSFFMFFNSPSLGAAHDINYTLSITYYVAFRNPKFGGSGLSKDLPSKSVTIPDTPADAMDDGIDIPDELLRLPEPIDDVDVSNLTASEAVAALEARRRQLKKNRAATASRVPVTKTV